jgi:hypothetical protein
MGSSVLSLLAGLGLMKRKLSVVFVAALVVTDHVEQEISGLARLGAGEATTDQPTDPSLQPHTGNN